MNDTSRKRAFDEAPGLIAPLASESLTAGETIAAPTAGVMRSDAAAGKVSPAVTQMRRQSKASRAEASMHPKQRDVRLEARPTSPPRALPASAPSSVASVAGGDDLARSRHQALLVGDLQGRRVFVPEKGGAA